MTDSPPDVNETGFIFIPGLRGRVGAWFGAELMQPGRSAQSKVHASSRGHAPHFSE